MVVVNTLMALLYLINGEAMAAAWPSAPPATFTVLVGISNAVFALALFRWKKWGFYGFAITAFPIFGINLYIGVGVAQALFGFAGVGILYWVLQMGYERKSARPHLSLSPAALTFAGRFSGKAIRWLSRHRLLQSRCTPLSTAGPASD